MPENIPFPSGIVITNRAGERFRVTGTPTDNNNTFGDLVPLGPRVAAPEAAAGVTNAFVPRPSDLSLTNTPASDTGYGRLARGAGEAAYWLGGAGLARQAIRFGGPALAAASAPAVAGAVGIPSAMGTRLPEAAPRTPRFNPFAYRQATAGLGDLRLAEANMGRPNEPLGEYIGRSPIIEPVVSTARDIFDATRYGAGRVRDVGRDVLDVMGTGERAAREGLREAYRAGRPLAEAGYQGATNILGSLGTAVLPPPKPMTPEEKQYYLNRNGGDINAARDEAIGDGYDWTAD